MSVFARSATAVILATWCCGCRPSAPANEYEELVKTLKVSEDHLNSVGKVVRKTYPPGNAWSIDLKGATVSDQVVNDILTLDRVSELFLSGATLTDVQLQTLLKSDRTGYLNVLDISNTAITDAGVAGLADKKYLQTLTIKGSQVTAAFVTSMNSARKANSEIGAKFKTVAVTK